MTEEKRQDIPFDACSKEKLQDLAARGNLIWQGKKVFFDPFLEVDFFCVVDQLTEDLFSLYGKIKTGNQEGFLSSCDLILSSGVLQYQTFRLWRDDRVWPWVQYVKDLQPLTKDQLCQWMGRYQNSPTAPPLVWNCNPSFLTLTPLPLLVLKDRMGAFADLWIDYGVLGKVHLHGEGHLATKEELSWERDLLETHFIKKPLASSHYYCPIDKVLPSLTFLLEVGWHIIDFRGKKVVAQKKVEWNTSSSPGEILVQGDLFYEDHRIDIQEAIRSFKAGLPFIDLKEEKVIGLLQFSSEWIPLIDEEASSQGISVKRHHFAFLEKFLTLPEEYQKKSLEALGEAFQGTLFPYQWKGVEWLAHLYSLGFSALLADEMGLGKTVQVIAFLSRMRLEHPVIIIAPVSLLYHWKRELERFLPSLNFYLHRGPHRLRNRELLQKHSIILTSYAQIRKDHLLFSQISFEALILDEAQAIKNKKNLTSEILSQLMARFKLAMTGTPIENRLEDLSSIFHFLMPKLLIDQQLSLEVIRERTRPFILRRTKLEVAPQLPEKQYQVIWVEMEEEERLFYKDYFKERKIALDQSIQQRGLASQKMKILELILRLRQLCCDPSLLTPQYEGPKSKWDRVCADIEEVVSSGKKLLLYSQFTSMLKKLKKWVEKQGYPHAYLDGKTQNREKVVSLFQEDPQCSIFLISLKAGGVGLNLQAADYVFLYDPWWNLAVEEQAIDRAHRIGRKGDVTIRKYLINQTIEEKIFHLQSQKEQLFQGFFSSINESQVEKLYLLLEELDTTAY